MKVIKKEDPQFVLTMSAVEFNDLVDRLLEAALLADIGLSRNASQWNKLGGYLGRELDTWLEAHSVTVEPPAPSPREGWFV
jgi:hypothetical protein